MLYVPSASPDALPVNFPCSDAAKDIYRRSGMDDMLFIPLRLHIYSGTIDKKERSS